MKLNKIIIAAIILCFSQLSLAGHHGDKASPNEAVVKGWVEARVAGQKENIAYVEKHMAEDGLFYGGRYVGFGFNFDPVDSGKMVVSRLIEDSPASKALEVGDEFTVVNGVEVNSTNMDKLSFRGKPGEPVKATIKRAGKMQDIEVSRGIISNISSKAVLIDDLNNANADDWTSKAKVVEMLSKGNVVYVWTTVNDADPINDLPFESHVVTRYEFNDSGLVVGVGALSEDRFVLEQTGYTVSR
jgi:membrane-associated protease RseP (regulator of RpoE activity)